mmetsp:Transcript_78700/g.155876  ORF Transcript_78700/g.155876 Transcript_78700/m.155876 type:complete len:81 (-) Transcript_78700:31-273(-)
MILPWLDQSTMCECRRNVLSIKYVKKGLVMDVTLHKCLDKFHSPCTLLSEHGKAITHRTLLSEQHGKVITLCHPGSTTEA